jgi:RHH-type proline utilization regulon transcriptional repressor/proline dehydrogenase/delta 1-pyrroline-5-carboxylate dehydrogenase
MEKTMTGIELAPRYPDEAESVNSLLDEIEWPDELSKRVEKRAGEYVSRVRSAKRKMGELESFFQQYGLNSEEGLALMTLAEALLRIPDAHTANALIRDKMVAADWLGKQGQSSDLLVKAAGLGLSITRKTLDSAVSRVGEPVIRKAMVEAMRMLGKQFVLGRTIEEGIKNAASYHKKGYRMSYDMLGEGARTKQDADRYFEIYAHAIKEIGRTVNGSTPGISVKLSALHPRYQYMQSEKCISEMVEILSALTLLAAENKISLTVDAEEVDRLEMSVEIISEVARDKKLDGWEGFGLAVQAYQKRALSLIDYMLDLSQDLHRRFQIRLVKGAYWDTEVKRAQLLGLDDYPVFTRKANTDVSYIVCAKRLLDNREAFYPMLATHNAHTIAAVMELAGNDRNNFEFQRLHGMGETLHDIVLGDGAANTCVYAPCGSHEDLLPYLVRRLLENGANSSFVNKLLDKNINIDEIVNDPFANAAVHTTKRHPKIVRPAEIYQERLNSKGFDITEPEVAGAFYEYVNSNGLENVCAFPLIAGEEIKDQGERVDIVSPANSNQVLGQMYAANSRAIEMAFESARQGYEKWSREDADTRARVLENIADLMERDFKKLVSFCLLEAGKTLEDAIAEIREAVDFCRYYALKGREGFNQEGISLPGPTGESNVLTLHGRGVFVCISPWNFPLAIFTGQIVAALMAGNSVIAKPAEQTPLIASFAAKLFLEAGVPKQAFHLLPGDGVVGSELVSHPDVAGVAFTGSTEVARLINRALAAKDGPIVPLIAETGGQNAMVIDSSALSEQVIDDVLISAFGSAGQRCSALRVLYVQEDVADRVLEMLKGAMEQRVVGDPVYLSTDIGPVIDEQALNILHEHEKKLGKIGRLIARTPLPDSIKDKGYFFAPVAYEIDSLSQLEKEVFGPILHVIRYRAEEIDKELNEINATGYGLTCGVHSRISSTMKHVTRQLDVGNAYVNRTTIGAVVGVQPFGGRGLSGTGPKAGGPYYLHRFSTEKVVSIDTTRQGGNASLVSLEE